MDKRGLVFQYETQALPYRIEAVYTPDFILPTCVVETKGLFSATDRRKMLAVKAAHRAPRSLTYGQWADRHGFVWCEGHIPTAWFDEGTTQVKVCQT